MQIQISGKGMDVGDSLHTHVNSKLQQISEKYFENPIEAHVTFSKEAHQVRADVTVHVSRGIVVQGHETGGDAYAAFDTACDRIRKQLQKYKDRLKDHSQRMQEVEAQHESVMAQQYILSSDEEEKEDIVDEGDQPAIIAEMATNIPTLSIPEAVMRLDLSNEPVIIFKNRSHEGLNVLYRRRDGNISWVDPEGFRKAAE